MNRSMTIIGSALLASVLAALIAGRAPAQEKLSRMLTHHLDKVTSNLDKAEKAVGQKNARRAKSYLADAEMQWKTFHEWNAGKFDPKQPDVVAAGKRMKAVRSAVAALTGKAAGMAKTLPPVLEAILSNEKKLAEAMRAGRMAFQRLQSEARDYRRIGEARKRLAELPGAVARVNQLLPVSYAAARDFRKQFPDLRELSKLVRNGRQAGQAMQRLERTPALWLEVASRVVKECLDTAESNIANYEKELKQAAGKNEAQKSALATNAYEWAVDHAGLMLAVPSITFPTLPKEVTPLFPGYARARNTFTSRARSLEARSMKIAAEIGKIQKQMVDVRERRLAAARFPDTRYRGGQWNGAEQEIRQAWAKKIRDKELLRIAIDSPWDVRTEARWRSGRWIIGTYRYISAHCLAKLRSGRCFVYHMTFRRTKQADGSFGALEQWSVGHVYEMSAKNIAQ